MPTSRTADAITYSICAARSRVQAIAKAESRLAALLPTRPMRYRATTTRPTSLRRVLAHRMAHPPARAAPKRRVERRAISIESAQTAGDCVVGELRRRDRASGRDDARELLAVGQERVHAPGARRAWTVPGGEQQLLCIRRRLVLSGGSASNRSRWG